MKFFFKKVLSIPFILLNKIKINGQPVLWKYANEIFSDSEKISLSKTPLFNTIISNGPPKGFMLVAYLNALQNETALAKKFTENMLANLPSFESQMGQDCIVDTICQQKRNGFFVEIGVGEGQKISNTFFLEKFRGWSGVLCEPSIKFHDSIREQRQALLVPEAIYNESGLKLKFCEVVDAEELSSLADHKQADAHNRSNTNDYFVDTISFNDLYKNLLYCKKIDYLSVDTEGSELLILSGIDYANIDISIISVEHNYDTKKRKELSSLLFNHGYTEILSGIFEFDSVFAKKDILDNF